MNKKTQQKLLKLVKTNYNDIAEQFNETRQKHSWQELIKLAKKVKSGSSVLDVGCGNGRLLKILPSNIKYLGVDSSKKLLNLAQQQHPQTTLGFQRGQDRASFGTAAAWDDHKR